MIREERCMPVILAGIFCLAFSLSAFATQGDPAFMGVDYTAGVSVGAMRQAQAGETSAIESAARAMANNFALVANAQGKTLLRPATVCDSVTLEGGRMQVRLTLPPDLKEGDVTETTVETVGEVLRYHFAEPARLREMQILARQGKEGAYRPLSDFLPPPAAAAPEEKDWCEPGGPGPQPAPDYRKQRGGGASSLEAIPNNVTGQGPLGTSGQPQGALSGRTVYFSAGHGWYWTGSSWGLMRPRLLQMNEDHGNIDQILSFAYYLFNAGATVVPMRPLGHQENEVVLDNTSAGVSWSGAWNDSTNARYYGPGSPPYRWTDAGSSDTATAAYTPNIPEAGFYPVYAWANYGSDRIPDQLYQIRHAGGTAQVRLNHRRVGCGWVWLGTYYFEAGSHPASGSVVISNQSSSAGVVIADAIRFGNGVGDVNQGGGISGYLRETECSRYWVQRGLGEGGSSAVYDGGGDDSSDNVGTPPRMAAQMRRDDGQGYNGDIYLGFHSNAASSSARGCVALITNYGGTPVNQADYATLLADELDADALVEDANWEHTWVDRYSPTYTSGYGEINTTNLGGEMCGTIIEVAFHSNTQDTELMRDPRVRQTFARSCYQGIVRYFNRFDGLALNLLPEPPVRVRAFNKGSGGVTVAWQPGPSGGAGGDAATGYVVYRSMNGLNFGEPVTTSGTSISINGLTAGKVYYFRVAAINAGGESLPSEVLAVRVRASGSSPILVVNGYDRIDRDNNVSEDRPPMSDVDRLHLRLNNSYDYVRTAAEAIDRYGQDFDSCSNEAVESADVALGAYTAVVWLAGEESSRDRTFSGPEQTAVGNYLNGRGKLFVSGSEIGWDLDNQGSGVAFYNNSLKADYAGDDAGTYTAQGSGGIFAALGPFQFDQGVSVYDVNHPDQIAAAGGSTVNLVYVGGGGGSAGVQFEGAFQVVYLGFPFEAITSADMRDQVMEAVLDFFGFGTNMPHWKLY